MGSDLVPVEKSALERATEMGANVAEATKRAIATGHYGSGDAFLMAALDASTIEEATTITEAISGKEHLNERIRYVDVTFLDGDPSLDSALPIFELCDVVREMGDGVAEKMSIGAAQPMGVLIRAAEQGWFPFDAELVSHDLGGGKKAINLQLAPQRVESGKDF
jgi:hypothetical protein